MSISIDCHGDSHVGRSRPANEDQFLIADLNKSMRVYQTSLGLNHQTRLFGGSQGKLMLVADGLGGHESGERASTLAVDGVANYILNAMDWFFQLNENREADFEAELKQAFVHSQTMLDAESEAIPQRRGMATTLTMAYVDWPKLYVVHVGDTRCYHIKGNTIKCLTTDHTMAQLARDNSGEAEAKDSDSSLHDTKPFNPMNHTLWNVIGGNSDSLDPQITRSELSIGDSLLLCSDGLTRNVPDSELLSTVNKDRSAKEICEEFIDIANDRGGKDNITAVLAKFHQNQSPSEDCAEQNELATIDLSRQNSKPAIGANP